MLSYDPLMERRRRASVAGTWYPAEPARLAADVDRHVAAAGDPVAAARVTAVVAPHAGLMYSGPVAAHAYGPLRGTRPGAIVLVGPSHFVAFRGVSLWSGGAWDTPFGPVPIEGRLAAALREASPDVVDVPAAHGREHSLEMQLPFIAHLMPGAPIVPLVMGRQDRATALALGETLSRVIAAERPADVLLVASSDLSHYEDARRAFALDEVVIRSVEAFDEEALMDALEREPGHACGGGAVVAVMRAARRLGATRSRVLRYADSGDVSGDKSSVVGYLAAAMW
jgi:hypothetical protein